MAVAFPQFASQRIVQNTTATLSPVFVDQDGEPRIPGEVTAQVLSFDGSEIVEAGTESPAGSDGIPVLTLNASQTSELDVLTCIWTEAGGATVTTYVEIVGGRYFTLLDARSVDPVLQETGLYPDEDVKRVRYEVELEVERITGRSFVPRLHVATSDGSRVGRLTPLQLSQTDIRSVRTVKVNGVTYSSGLYELTPGGQIAFGDGVGLTQGQVANGPTRLGLSTSVEVAYEHGWPAPPKDLQRAMLTRLRSRLLAAKTAIPDRATTMTVNGSTFALSTPGLRGANTGIPDVDSVYDDYTRDDWKNNFVGSLRIV